VVEGVPSVSKALSSIPAPKKKSFCNCHTASAHYPHVAGSYYIGHYSLNIFIITEHSVGQRFVEKFLCMCARSHSQDCLFQHW
jgi:hypothetical protein